MKEKKEETKRIILSVLGVLLLLCSVFVVGFAVFVFEDTSNHENTITTGTISFSYNEKSNGIDLVNAIPIDDAVGMKLTNSNKAQGINQGYFEFSVQASGSAKQSLKYQIYATLQEDSDMDPNYIKVYLTDDQDRPYPNYTSSVPVFTALENYNDTSDEKVLYKGTIIPTENKTQRFRLRLWVAKDYADGSTSKTFKIKVNVKAIA